jgi:nucleoside-diphosphate-sugar epimerase
MIGLQDAVDSMSPPRSASRTRSFDIFNQTSGPVGIQEIGEGIQAIGAEMGIPVQVDHLENPRVEKEEHQMVMENSRFMNELLPHPTVDITTACGTRWRASSRTVTRCWRTRIVSCPSSC